MGNGNGQLVRVPQPGEVSRQEFSASQLELKAETASGAMAAQAKAAVEARYLIAIRRPRDLMQAREKLLTDCRRPFFAEKAIYHKPIGDGIEGPSIRLAESAARAMGNIYTETPAIYDDPRQRIVRVLATDLESNLTFQKDVTVQKIVERRSLRKGQVALGQRLNSHGDIVYIVEATDDDILNKENALISKAMRTQILRIVPADLIEEAMAEARKTMRNEAAKDPEAAKKGMCDAFAELGVTTEAIAQYLGHAVASITPDEISHMRSLYAAIRDGEATWDQAMENRKPSPTTETQPATQESAAAATGEPAQATAADSPPAATPTAPKGKANLTDVAAASKAKRETKEGGAEKG